MKTQHSFFWLILTFACFMFSRANAQPPTWHSRGVGGGGAFYAPSINPANPAEIYVSSDMSELYHSTNAGAAYDLLSFAQINGRHNSFVRFTNISGLQYCISYKMQGASDYYALVKTTDGGMTWNEVPNGLDRYSELFALFVDYNNPNRIILSDYSTVRFSNDGGLTFTTIYSNNNGGNGLIVGGAWFDGTNLYVATINGLYRSTDGGANWAAFATTGLPAGNGVVSFVAAKQNGHTRFYAVTAQVSACWVNMTASGSDYQNMATGVYRLDLPGAAWQPVLTGLNLANDYPEFVDCAENDTSVCYLAGGCSVGHPRIWKTTNGGFSWSNTFLTTNNQNIVTGWSGHQGDRAWTYGEVPMGFSVCKSDNNLLYFTDFGFIHRSTNGGTSWKQLYVDMVDEHPANAATPQNMSYHSVGVENTTSWQVHWADANTLMGCFSDIRGIRSTDGGTSWGFNYTGHNGNSMYRIAQANNGTLYSATSNVHDMYQSTRLSDGQLDANDSEGKVLFSTNKGATWQLMHFFNHPVFWVALDPNDNEKLYASVIHSTLGGIYMTTNASAGAGSTWAKLPNPPRTEGHPASIVVLNDGKVVATYSGRRAPGFTASSGCFIWDGTLWQDVSHTGMHYWTKDIVIDPSDPLQHTWYVCVFSGWGGAPNGLGGIYKTTNRGASWTKIWNSDRVTSLTFNPGNLTEAYVTTEVEGLWLGQNLHTPSPSFSLVTNYPFRQPERVFFNPYDSTQIWVTSFGGGLRMGYLNPPPPPQSNNHPLLFLDSPTKAMLMAKKNANDPDWLALKTEADAYSLKPVLSWSPANATVWNTNYIFYNYCGSSWDDAAMSLGMAHQLSKGANTGAYPTVYSDKLLELADSVVAAYYRYPPCNGCNNIFQWNSSYATRHLGNVLGIVFDWCYEELGSSRKTALINLMNDWFAYMRVPYNTYQNDMWATGNYFFGNVLCAAYMGHATMGDNPMSQEMIDYARQRVLGSQSGNLLPADYADNWLKQTYEGGYPSYASNSYLGPATYEAAPQKDGMPVQGWAYTGGTVERLIDYCFFVKSATGENIVDSLSPYLQKVSEAFIHALTPNRFQVDNSNDWGSFVGNLMSYSFPLRLAAATEGMPVGPNMQYLYTNWIQPVSLAAIWNKGYPELNWEKMLYVKPNRPSAPFNLPTYYPAPATNVFGAVPINQGIPKFYLRNNWTGQSTWAALNMSSAFYDDHDHDNAGHFQIVMGDNHDGDDLLLVGANEVGNQGAFGLNGIEGGTCYHGSSSLSNTLYFDDFNVYSNPDNTGLHKGGQTGYGYDEPTHQEQTDLFTYVRSCLTSAYYRKGEVADTVNRTLDYFYRSFLYLREVDVFLSYDNFKAKNSTHANGQYIKHLRWHFLENPTISGNHITATMDNSKLHVHTVLPANVSINKIDESNNPDNTFGSWMNYAFNTFTWRAEVVQTGNPLKQDILTVLQPSTLLGAEMVTNGVQSISGNMEGTSILLNGKAEWVLFNKSTHKYLQPVTATSYPFAGPQTAWHTLCGMVPNGTYQVDYDGTNILVALSPTGNKTASPSGVLRFQTPNNPLPITELYFVGFENQEKNTLQWSCNSSDPLQWVVLQRAANAADWQTLVTLPFEQGKMTYYNDLNPPQSAYYRLAFQDLNQQQTYSNIVQITRQGDYTPSLYLMPNPASDKLVLYVEPDRQMELKVAVYDFSGRLVETHYLEQPRTSLDISTWASGMYYFHVFQPDGRRIQTLPLWKE